MPVDSMLDKQFNQQNFMKHDGRVTAKPNPPPNPKPGPSDNFNQLFQNMNPPPANPLVKTQTQTTSGVLNPKPVDSPKPGAPLPPPPVQKPVSASRGTGNLFG